VAGRSVRGKITLGSTAHYRASTTQVWTPETGTVTRTGLCARCDAAIYGSGRDNVEHLYHAVADGLILLPTP